MSQSKSDWGFQFESDPFYCKMKKSDCTLITPKRTDIFDNPDLIDEEYYPLPLHPMGTQFKFAQGLYIRTPAVSNHPELPECIIQMTCFAEVEKFVACKLHDERCAYITRKEYFDSKDRDLILRSDVSNSDVWTTAKVHSELLTDYKAWFFSREKSTSKSGLVDVSLDIRPEVLIQFVRFLYGERVELTAAEYLYMRHVYLKQMNIWHVHYVQEALIENIPIPATTNDEKNYLSALV